MNTLVKTLLVSGLVFGLLMNLTACASKQGKHNWIYPGVYDSNGGSR